MYSPCLFRLRLLLAYIASLTLKSWLCKKSAYSSNPSLVLQRRWKSLSFQRGLQKNILLYYTTWTVNFVLWIKSILYDIQTFQIFNCYILICPIRGENLSLFNLKFKHEKCLCTKSIKLHECKTLLMCVNSYVGTYLVSIRFWGIANFDSQCCILLLWM